MEKGFAFIEKTISQDFCLDMKRVIYSRNHRSSVDDFKQKPKKFQLSIIQ
jgi:hypothetical protein